jgi:hypothetical protein
MQHCCTDQPMQLFNQLRLQRTLNHTPSAGMSATPFLASSSGVTMPRAPSRPQRAWMSSISLQFPGGKVDRWASRQQGQRLRPAASTCAAGAQALMRPVYTLAALFAQLSTTAAAAPT